MYEDFARIYDERIHEDFDYSAMADFVRRVIGELDIPVRTALDMGCGTGNASLALADVADELILCDPSAEMLTLAQAKFAGARQPMFIQAPAATFRMPGRFDLIYAVLDVPNYLAPDELEGFLDSSSVNLTAGGALIFDLTTPEKLTDMARSGPFIYDDEDYFHVWENELVGDRLDLTINAFVRSSDHRGSLYERITEEQTMYLHSISEITETARRRGLTVAGRWDGYTTVKAAGGSDRVVFVLTKGESTNG